MKSALIAVAFALALSSCATTTTTQTLPDGTKVVIVAKSSDPVAIKAALDAAQIIGPVIERLAIEQAAHNEKPDHSSK